MDKRESLLARYERVLGRPPADVEPEDSAVEGSEAHSTPSSSKRREQVLQAQRTHRQRTQQYIRELEKEVFRLRDENEELGQVMERMRTQMDRMKAALSQGGIAFDEEMDGSTEMWQQQEQPPLQQHYSHQNRSATNADVSVDLTGLATVVPEGACQNKAAETAPPVYHPRTSGPDITRTLSQLLPPQPTLPADRETSAQIGINFILTLETPCLPHVKHAHMGYRTGTTPQEVDHNSGPDHLLNASAILTHRYASQDIETSTLSLPSLEIEKLLETCGRLNLDNEVTPVQIWTRIADIGKQKETGVSEDQIQQLITEFGKYVYCNSFGAVVEKATAEAVLADVLGVVG